MSIASKAMDARSAMRHRMPDGVEVAVIAGVMDVKLVVGDPKRRMQFHDLDAAAARAILRLLLKWWAWTCWFGLREWFVRRGLRRAFEQAGLPAGKVKGVQQARR